MAYNFDRTAIGTVINVENKDWRGKSFYVFKLKQQDGTELNASSYDNKIWDHFNAQHTIQFSYAAVPKGDYINNYVDDKSIRVVSGGGVPSTQQAAPSSATTLAVAGTPTSTSPDARSEQIVRQSSIYQAVSIYNTMAMSDNLPFPKTEKGKKLGAAKDPQAILALVFDMAGQIKDHVFNGNWEQPLEGMDVPPDIPEEEIPF